MTNVNAKVLFIQCRNTCQMKLRSSHISVWIGHVYERHSLYVFKADSAKNGRTEQCLAH